VQEFVAEEILAFADIGLRRQHADGILARGLAAVIGLARPDRQHDIAGHAELALDARERRLVLRGKLGALRGEAREIAFAQILSWRLHELGLLRLLFRAAGNGEIGQREVGLKAADGGVEGGARDAELLRVGPGGLEEGLEGGVGEGELGKNERRHKQQNCYHPRKRVIQ